MTMITWEFVALLASLAGNVVMVIGLLKKNMIYPQPLSVRQAEMFVTPEQCANVHEQTALRVRAVEQTLQELKLERREDMGELHSKVNGVAREVSELKAASVIQTNQLTRIDEKLGELQLNR